MDITARDNLQGELERLFSLDQLKALSADALGFDPDRVGGTGTAGAFAKALVDYCYGHEALPALVDAIQWLSGKAQPDLRSSLKHLENGELKPGTAVGNLRVVRKLGEGGLGVVYLAESQSNDHVEQAALKVIRPEYARDRAAVHRYITAARFVRKLGAQGVVAIKEVGQLADARPWIAAAYLPGQTLAERIKRDGPLHIHEAMPIFRAVLQGLSALHDRGLTHGDIKAENVFLAHHAATDGPAAVLVDPGADRLLAGFGGPASASTTGVLPLLGTPKALSPEQARGAEVSPISEVYSAGTLMYETLTGRPPFVGDSAIDVIAAHLNATPQPPSQHVTRGTISDALDRVILRALSKRPQDRYPDIRMLAEALDGAARKPIADKPLDEAAFESARNRLLGNLDNDAYAQHVEELAGESGAWERAAQALWGAAEQCQGTPRRVELLLRVARIYDQELQEPVRAEDVYLSILELDSEHEGARRGVERARRSLDDPQGLVEVLLARAKRSGDPATRLQLLKEVAHLHETRLNDPHSAARYYTEVLLASPMDEDARQGLSKVGLRHQGTWNDVLQTLGTTAQSISARLKTSRRQARREAEIAVQEARANVRQQRARCDELAASRKTPARGQAAARDTQGYPAGSPFEDPQAQAKTIDLATKLDEVRHAITRMESEVAERSTELEEVHRQAEAKLDEYEALRTEIGDAPSDQQTDLLAELAEDAEEAVDAADAAASHLEHLNAQVQQEHQRAAALAAELQSLTEGQEHTQELSLSYVSDIELLELTEADHDEGEDPYGGLADEEREQLAAAEARLAKAEATLETLASADEEEPSGEDDTRDRTEGAALYALIGDLYFHQLKRPDLAQSSYQEALALDETHEAANAGLAGVYRSTHAWASLCDLLLRRADRTDAKARGRDLRAEAAQLMVDKLGDQQRARPLLEMVIAEDPGHAAAQQALSDVLMRERDYDALVALLEQRLHQQEGVDEIATHLLLSELYEQVSDAKRALEHLRTVLELDDQNRTAAKGMRRLAEMVGDHEALSLALKAEVSLATTPKQRILAWERLAQLEEDEFVNLPGATACYERILELNPRNVAANGALPRLYRQLKRFEDAAQILIRQAEFSDDGSEKAERWMQAAHIFAQQAPASARAIELCERTLHLNDQHAGALSLLAQLRAASGDMESALKVVERLCSQVPSGRPRAQQLLRMASMSEEAGERNGALLCYKRALDEDPSSEEAITRLLTIYKAQGDVHGAIDMLRRAAATTEGELRRAQLMAELGTLMLDELSDVAQARVVLQEAFDLDPANALAAVGLGKLALAENDDEGAVTHFNVAMGRLSALDRTTAAEAAFYAGEALLKTDDLSGAVTAFRTACDLDPEPLAYHERHADAIRESGDLVQARTLYADILNTFDGRLEAEDAQRLLLHLSETQRVLDDPEAALESLQQANRLGENRDILAGLAQSYSQLEAWSDLVHVLQQQIIQCEDETQRYDLYVRMGDVLLDRQGDYEAAAQHYALALEEQPKDRHVLHKLVKVYSDLNRWPQLLEVIQTLADVSDDPAERSKYRQTAASIALNELQQSDRAASLYEAALADLPIAEAGPVFEALRSCLSQTQDWDRLERSYANHAKRLLQGGADPKLLAGMLDERAALLHDRLDRPHDAIEALEEAQALDPENTERLGILTAAYSREPKRYFSRALSAQRQLLDLNPYDAKALSALRRVYTADRRPDESWCICQALRILGAADAEEERFFKKYRLTRLARFRQALSEEMFRNYVMHPAQDALVTGMFAAMTPAITVAQSHPLEAFGLTPQQQTDPSTDHTAIGRMLALAADAVGNRLPDVYHCPHDPGGLSFLCVVPPAIGIGRGAAAGGPQQALAFVAARHSSYYRPGHLPRQLVPTGTGLRAWLMASIRMVAPNFGVPPNMEGQVGECLETLKGYLTGPQRDTLRSMTQKLLDAAPELDMRRWMAGVDLTADRLGFVLSNDLKLARAVIEASPEDTASIPRSEREQELIRYATSEAYFELRKRLGIALGG